MQPRENPPAWAPVVGVFFDMGGTLYSYGARHQMGQATIAALRRLGLDPDAPEVREARRIAAEEISRRYATRSSFLHRRLFRDRLARTAELLGVEASPQLLHDYDIEHARAIVEHMPPKPDAASVLRALGQRGIHRAIVSNADDSWLEPAIMKHGFDTLLEGWTSSEEAASCKPDRRIFSYALAKAGLDARDVVFVGDSIPHDIVGAHSAGLRTVLITDHDGPTPLASGLDAGVEPDHRIGALIELLDLVDRANGSR